MDERDRSIRLEALELAVRNPTTGSDTAETIVGDAEKYFTFLKGEESESDAQDT